MDNTNDLQQGSGLTSSSIRNNNALSVNTTAIQQNYNNGVSYLSSPTFRRTMLSNVRQSWVFSTPPSIPEAESVYVHPTAILEKNKATAKSRLSIFVQKDGGNQQQHGRVITNSTINEAPDMENLTDNELSSSPTSSRPISNVSSSVNQDSSEYDALSDSSHSLSSSFASTSITTNNRDSMSDITSMLSNSPSIPNDDPNKFNRLPNNNVPRHRYSIPSASKELNSPRQYIIAPRRASMPILSNNTDSDIRTSSMSSDIPIMATTLYDDDDDEQDDELKEIVKNNSSFLSPNASNESSIQEVALRTNRLSSPANAQLAQRASRASMRMSLNSLMQKRFNIAFEILTTERHYVDCLQLVQRLFLDPLTKSLSSANPILSKKSINEIFANLPELINVNTELLRRLDERIAITIDDKPIEDSEDKFWNPEDGCLGDVFLNMAPFFKMYSIYVKNFNSALSVIDVQLRDNPTFSAFLRDIIKTGQCKGLTLQAYLIMPVQRIPRYKLLLEDLLKKTVETHPDYLNLKKAYQVIENVATFVNETIRQHEMFITMLEIQKSLTGFDEVLLVPGRTFIKRGIVKKICRRTHQKREFFLFSDILIYASPSLMDDTYTFHRKFSLEDVTILVVEDTQYVKNGFQIMSPQKSFTVYADTQKEKESWINATRDAKEEYLSAKRTLKIDNNERLERKDLYKKRIVENYHAPVWIPDSKADRCMNCSEEFTIFRRKHHCRACGKVVCHACSTRNFVIPGTVERDDQLARACDSCFFTMFPDALRDEDLAPGIHVWDLVGNRSTTSLVESSQKDDNIKDKEKDNVINECNKFERTIFKNIENNRASVVSSSLKYIHDAIVAKRCEQCRVDLTVFRWRNTCLKCKKIVCTDCLTKKPIDFSSLPKEILEALSSDETQTVENTLNKRLSTTTNVIKICDFCYLGIDPSHVTIDEETDGWSAKGQITPPSTPEMKSYRDNHVMIEKEL
ncbi:hypothetical protein RhiirA5_361397 [Rhizophagus irregularis]|uniref:Rom2p n=3 Tax=Rhizophagus irregularis TaxID=588596 RepID=A0A2I1F0G8_9GLOM|nr:hypothetical protein GLOIN_2v1563407 [Rhizophagus irregularis DAOM 181602=DAOM 197198]EXX56345.1 Rom2p [Rhizophagus irregularis DAOM 197198w]PKC05388.1 hypothetical protein RhiirA5_361397 [Rhizophagus irregularis]PKC65666.1 hypothetical protein RhiirA1_420189 [Rhizophagus irregularis]PKK67305.1 hypothetical protein RhiirC2_751961 [Rhizophagus irregularis]PKY27858.1 hypothetical protein RhiirB3_416463 [Rhizophagus irregularis]|eukprot:XP_025182438.1 hypothetical protein GLOIN_2v1563407 [Rhizophagus irregularis DAOM 181602=DAOM 197198]